MGRLILWLCIRVCTIAIRRIVGCWRCTGWRGVGCWRLSLGIPALVRLGVRLGFGQEYEIAAVAENGLKAGGVGNSATPNFIHRWTEREIEKTVHTFAPEGRAEFRYFSALRVPKRRMQSMKNRLVAGSFAGSVAGGEVVCEVVSEAE